MNRKLITGLLLITTLFIFNIASMAAEPEDFIMQVTANLPVTSAVKAGQAIEFEIIIYNNSDEEEKFIVINNQSNLSEEIVVAGRTVQTRIVVTEVPDVELFEITFTCRIRDKEISTASYSYPMVNAADISFNIAVKRESNITIGGTIQYIATIRNNTDRDFTNLKIEQGLTTDGFKTIDALKGGETRDFAMEYRIPSGTPVGQDVKNVFSLSVDKVTWKEIEVPFNIPVSDSIKLSAKTEPSAYAKGNLVDIIVTIENTGEITLNNLAVRAGAEVKILNEIRGSTSQTLKFPYLIVADKETLYFSIYDGASELMALTSIDIVPINAVFTEETIEIITTTEFITVIPIADSIDGTINATVDAITTNPPQTRQTSNKSFFLMIIFVIFVVTSNIVAMKSKKQA